MRKITLVLTVALIAVPLLAWKFDQPSTAQQWHMLHAFGVLMLGVAALCFVIGELTDNIGQVDKLWSVLPPLYAWVLSAQCGWDSRMALMAALATVWGVRLTYNFSRHGGYNWKFWSGAEDYRWAHVRRKPALQGRVRWALFDVFFIAFFQNALLLLVALPIVLADPGKLLVALFLSLVTMEAIADQQQWNFQTEKKRRVVHGTLEGRYARGFIAEGPWSRARHPNYFAEQAIWVVFFLFSVAATAQVNWTVFGCLLLMLLFQGGADLKEGICPSKHPQYADYARRTPRFIPQLFS